MITVDYSRLDLFPGARLLDLGCGQGRHSYEAYRRGADVTAFDQSEKDLLEVKGMFAAMAEAGEAGPGGEAATVQGDARSMPFDDASFDRVIAAEVLEHIHEDTAVMAEIVRVLRPGGLAVVTVPRWLPEKVCWLLSDAYHANEGGHIRIYTREVLETRLAASGLEVLGHHHAHALHSPYWWLKCAVGVDNDANPAVKAYHRLLVWDMMSAPPLTRWTERALNPVIGKSVVVYLRKPADGA